MDHTLDRLWYWLWPVYGAELPDDVWLAVLRETVGKDLFRRKAWHNFASFARVSLRFAAVAESLLHEQECIHTQDLLPLDKRVFYRFTGIRRLCDDEGAEPFFPSQLTELTCRGFYGRSISHLTNLQTLRFTNADAFPIDLSRLCTLTRLRFLRLDSQETVCARVLANACHALERLELFNIEIDTLAPLSRLTTLQLYLIAGDTACLPESAFSTLPALTSLRLGPGYRMTDCDQAYTTRITDLSLSWLRGEDVTALCACTNLTDLRLVGTTPPSGAIRALCSLASLRLEENCDIEATEIASLPRLRRLDLRGQTLFATRLAGLCITELRLDWTRCATHTLLALPALERVYLRGDRVGVTTRRALESHGVHVYHTNHCDVTDEK